MEKKDIFQDFNLDVCITKINSLVKGYDVQAMYMGVPKELETIYYRRHITADLLDPSLREAFAGYAKAIERAKKQEKQTPEFQKLMERIREKYGSEANMPKEIREEFHKDSKAIMGYNAMLTFNFRAGMFFIFCLADIPVANFIFEIVAMSLLTYYINHRHETFCRKIAERI